MSEAPEFPQTDPAIKYIVDQVSKIEDQYACNAGYHRDHKAIKQRLDNLDIIISELKKIVITIGKHQEKEDTILDEFQSLNAHLDSAVDSAVEKANQEILQQFKGEQNIRLEELRNGTREANKTLRDFNEKSSEINHHYELINERLRVNLKEECSKIINVAWQKIVVKYVLVSTACCFFALFVGIVVGKFIM
jgi:hypothetical protein